MMGHFQKVLGILQLFALAVRAQQSVYGQCGGIGWTGPTTCVSGSGCVYSNPYYSQCIPGAAGSPTTTTTSTTSRTTTSPTTGSTTTSAPPSSKTFVVMPLGDSITFLSGTVSGCWRCTLYRNLVNAGWKIDFVGTQTGQTCSGGDYDKNNEGHAGYQAYNIASQNQLVGWLNSVSTPDIIMMHLGTNDITSGRSTTDITNAFTTLVTQMRNKNSKVKILVSQIIPYQNSGIEPKVQALNSAIPSWASSHNSTTSPIFIVDVHTGMTTSDYLSDGIHENDSGNAKMAAKYTTAMTQILRTF